MKMIDGSLPTKTLDILMIEDIFSSHEHRTTVITTFRLLIVTSVSEDNESTHWGPKHTTFTDGTHSEDFFELPKVFHNLRRTQSVLWVLCLVYKG